LTAAFRRTTAAARGEQEHRADRREEHRLDLHHELTSITCCDITAVLP
jgi:hypothetical protein